MKKIIKEPPTHTFVPGELYLFHSTNRECPTSGSLWGVYDREEDGVVYLESSTLDMRLFEIWHPLPNRYCYSRLATRAELRDYTYILGRIEAAGF